MVRHSIAPELLASSAGAVTLALRSSSEVAELESDLAVTARVDRRSDRARVLIHELIVRIRHVEFVSPVAADAADR